MHSHQIEMVAINFIIYHNCLHIYATPCCLSNVKLMTTILIADWKLSVFCKYYQNKKKLIFKISSIKITFQVQFLATKKHFSMLPEYADAAPKTWSTVKVHYKRFFPNLTVDALCFVIVLQSVMYSLYYLNEWY